MSKEKSTHCLEIKRQGRVTTGNADGGGQKHALPEDK